jgi:hypothetical protein
VQKTRARKVVTLHIGEIRARETVLVCKTCKRTERSRALRQLVAPGGNFGYDVMVYVGRALFLRHRTGREIVAELAVRNVAISTSEVDRLGKTFVIYLAIAHRQSCAALQEAMRAVGGYILHLDGTFDGRGPILMSALDSITQIVLANVKLPSERAEVIVPFLQDVQRAFGDPIALVHDMGAGILKAVAEVFPNTPDFICHYHFLADIGKDLFGRENDWLRKHLRARGITSKLRRHARDLKRFVDADPRLVEEFCDAMANDTPPQTPPATVRAISAYSLIQWTLDGKNQGGGYGFPFDRPHLVFAQRLARACSQLHDVRRPNTRGAAAVDRILFKLVRDLKMVTSDACLHEIMETMKRKTTVFDQLRHALALAPESGSQGLNCHGMDADIQTIEKRVKGFCRRLRESGKLAEDKAYKKLLDQIEKYEDKLFSDPIVVPTPEGEISIQPQRTNNIMERFFRAFKRGWRRKTGNGSMGKTLKTMIADTPLVANLDNPQYINILLAGKTTLQERFAEIDIHTIRQESKHCQEALEKIPPKIKKLIALPQFHEKLTRIFPPNAQTA